MTPSVGNVDIVHQSWGTKDFYEYKFGLELGEIISVPLAAEASLGEEKYKLLIINDISKISQAFDQMASKELETEKRVDWEALSYEERLRKIVEFDDHLDHLKTNLTNHNQYLKEKHEEGSDHTPILKEISSQKVCLKKIKADLQKEAEELLVSTIIQFKKERFTTEIDYAKYILKAEMFVRLLSVEKVSPYHRLINENYLHSLSHHLTLSSPIELVLKKMGYKDSVIKEQLDRIRPQIADDFQSAKDLPDSSLKLYEKIQNKIQSALFKKLGIDVDTSKRLKQLSKKLLKDEIEYDRVFTKLLFKFKKDLKERVNQEIDHFDPGSHFSLFIERTLNSIEGSAIINELEQLSVTEPSLKEISDLYTDYHKGIKGWFARNAPYKNFSFQQSYWGEQFQMNEGVCKTVNYRWIKLLLQKPYQPIHSIDDLDPKANVKDRNTFITPSDRKMMAEFLVKKDPVKMPENILKRDKMKEVIVIPFEKYLWSAEYLIRVLRAKDANEDFMKESSGIFELGIGKIRYNREGNSTGFSERHAMGIQIDEKTKIYRFWDVESGFYTYPTLDMLIEELTSYQREFYKSKFDCFAATQYTKLA